MCRHRASINMQINYFGLAPSGARLPMHQPCDGAQLCLLLSIAQRTRPTLIHSLAAFACCEIYSTCAQSCRGDLRAELWEWNDAMTNDKVWGCVWRLICVGPFCWFMRMLVGQKICTCSGCHLRFISRQVTSCEDSPARASYDQGPWRRLLEWK